jgi:hypothetical protein
MRSLPLTTIKGGINRLRVKGGARPDNLYDLVNGYVTEVGTVKVRPGSLRSATLDPLTRGICAFGGELHTFCHTNVDVPEGYVLNILVHPDPPDPDFDYDYDYYSGYAVDPYADGVPLKTIHFAEPFLGGLYIVAEFVTDDVYHFWLQPGTTWAAETTYEAGDLVAPTDPNGLLYRASRAGDPLPPWQPDEPRYDGIADSAYTQSEIEPTTANGFYYVCIETKGPNPRSGSIEPTWPIFKGGTVIERTDTGIAETETIDSPSVPPGGSTTGTDSTTTPEDPFDRYRLTSGDFNLGGGRESYRAEEP